MIPRYHQFRGPTTRRVRRNRGGLMVMAALVCLLVITTIVAGMLRGAIRARRHLHVERDCRQTELLLEAGAERTVARLAGEPNYSGDVWKVNADSIIGHADGQVTTTVTRNPDSTMWEVHVAAEYPLDRGFPIRRSHTFEIAIPKTQSQE